MNWVGSELSSVNGGQRQWAAVRWSGKNTLSTALDFTEERSQHSLCDPISILSLHQSGLLGLVNFAPNTVRLPRFQDCFINVFLSGHWWILKYITFSDCYILSILSLKQIRGDDWNYHYTLRSWEIVIQSPKKSSVLTLLVEREGQVSYNLANLEVYQLH